MNWDIIYVCEATLHENELETCTSSFQSQTYLKEDNGFLDMIETRVLTGGRAARSVLGRSREGQVKKKLPRRKTFLDNLLDLLSQILKSFNVRPSNPQMVLIDIFKFGWVETGTSMCHSGKVKLVNTTTFQSVRG